MLADAAQALADGVRDLLDGDVDELAGQLGDEALELELLLESLLPVGRTLVGPGRHGTQHEGTFGGPQRTHAYLVRPAAGGVRRVGVHGVRREHVDDRVRSSPSRRSPNCSLLTVDQHDRALRIQDQDAGVCDARRASRVRRARYFALLTAVSFTSSEAKSSTTKAPSLTTIFAAGASVPAPLPCPSISMSTTAKS